MSKSKQGTRSTKSYIDTDSCKYVARSDLGFTKRGDQTKGTDSAHIFGWGLMQTIQTNTAGRPMSEARTRELARDMNHESNLRIKSEHGNRRLDERRDARIAHAFVSGSAIHGNSTATRAYQAYISASSFTTMDSIAEQLGNMRVSNPETGRTHMLKHHHKYK